MKIARIHCLELPSSNATRTNSLWFAFCYFNESEDDGGARFRLTKRKLRRNTAQVTKAGGRRCYIQAAMLVSDDQLYIKSALARNLAPARLVLAKQPNKQHGVFETSAPLDDPKACREASVKQLSVWRTVGVR